VLPIPDQPSFGPVTYDAKDPDTKFPPIEPLRPPQGAPNVLVILLDDVGFGASSAFGGPCDTPTAEKLAAGGLKYTRFHSTALCAPTRQALLTGRNHHSVAMGSITETATSAPGQSSLRSNTKAPLALTLKLNGYSTGQFGKCHEVPVWQSSPMGPFDMWPSGGGGFEYFYGFIGGENNQWYPALYEGLNPVEPPKTPEQGYHLTEDLADHAIDWVRTQKALMPDKPFFMYFAPGATHAPHHVPAEWADKYRGKFAHGWDAQRQITFARQKELGVIGADADLTAWHGEIPAWDDMPEELKPVLEREMEVYAGFLEHTDYHVGRVIDALEQLDVLADTLVFYIIGDNGASAEGTLQGAFNQMANFNGEAAFETPEFMVSRLGELGTPTSYNHYAVGWAWAMDTPYQWTKQVASHWGGTRNGTIVHWPRGITGHGGTRTQFCHVIDVAPTILEAAGIPEPAFVNGVQQSPMEGTSMVCSLNDAEAPERHDLQYFEMFGNRGVYSKGWSAVTKHRTPWEMVQAKLRALDDDIWELYDGSGTGPRPMIWPARCPASCTSFSGYG
jgi:arylsulfatase A-like enzyme